MAGSDGARQYGVEQYFHHVGVAVYNLSTTRVELVHHQNLSRFNPQRQKKRRIELALSRSLVVSMFAFNSDDWSLNPAEVYLKFFFKKYGLKRTKRAGVGPFLKHGPIPSLFSWFLCLIQLTAFRPVFTRFEPLISGVKCLTDLLTVPRPLSSSLPLEMCQTKTNLGRLSSIQTYFHYLHDGLALLTCLS